MKRNLIILLAACLFSMALCAEPISKQQAQQVAAQWLKSKNAALMALADPSMMKTDVVLKAVNEKGNPYLYAVSSGNSGYVLVSGDDRAPAILGYVEKGSYDERYMPDNMRSWLQHYIDEIAWLQQHNLTSPRETIADLGEPIAKTTTSLWDQMFPYNTECPMVTTYSDAACTTVRREPLPSATGCSATALAQVLYMWKDEYAKPEVKEGKLSQDVPARVDLIYQSAEREGDNKIPVWLKFTDEAIPASTTIDWANLVDVYSERDSLGRYITNETNAHGTPQQQAAVATLMHVCGSISDMMYGTIYSGGSGTFSNLALKGAAQYLGFSNARFEQQFLYNYNEWVQRLYNELKVAKAVYFGGSSTEGGHAFVIDGYSHEDLFHVNWGWSGLANEAKDDGGYYRINSMLPINQGTGGAVVNDGYRLNQSFITGLYPNAPVPPEAPAVTASILNTFETQANIRQGKLKLRLFSNGTNQTAPVITAQVALCLENESGYKSLIPLGNGLKTIYLTEGVQSDTVLTWTGLTDGDYKIRMYFRSSLDRDEAWTLCTNADNSYISVQVDGDQAIIRNRGSIEVDLLSYELNDHYNEGEDVAFKLKYKLNKGDIQGILMASIAFPIMKNEEGDFVADDSRAECTAMPPAIVMATEGEEFTVESVLSAANLQVGLYQLICASLAGFLPTDITFEVVESGSTSIEQLSIVGNSSSKPDNTWYDMQGRKLNAKPTEPGIYIIGGNKILIK